MRYLYSALLAMLIFSTPQNLFAQNVENFWAETSKVAVIDGDTMWVDGRVVKLGGIDAPEIGQECDHNGHLWSCGMTAALDLHKAVAMARLTKMHCWVNSKTSVWINATCYVGEKDLAAAMLGAGTVQVANKTTPHYISLEQNAREAEFGIWGSLFADPTQWAEKRRLKGDANGCVFKGLRNKKGKRVFYSPLSTGYKDVNAEKMFCSDEDALLEDYEPVVKVVK